MNTVASDSITGGLLQRFKDYFSDVPGVKSPWPLQFALGRPGVGAHLHVHKVRMCLCVCVCVRACVCAVWAYISKQCAASA